MEAPTVQSVISSVVQTVAIIAPLAGLGTFGITEFAKKVGLPGRWAGIFCYVVGFAISILVMGITTHAFWSPLSILIGIIVAVGTPGVYSGVKSAATSSPAPVELAPPVQ